MNQFQKELFVSWDDMQSEANALAQRIKETFPDKEWKGIAAVTRGGLIPACLVAQKLDIRLIETICVVSYDHQDQTSEANIVKMPEGDGEGWLIIDDLVDTGDTFRLIRKHIPKAHFAAVYAKPNGIETADTFIAEVSQNTWIFFPWEIETQQRLAEEKNNSYTL